MSHQILNSFSSFQLTEEEAKSGTILSVLQKQVIQNLIAQSAEARLALEVDPVTPVTFIQQEAYLKGKIEILKYLIESSEYEEAQQVQQSLFESQEN